MFQPYTTDTTPNGLLRARNALREKLWHDEKFAHNWLCHDGNSKECCDGCDALANPERLELYISEIEETF